MLCLLCLVLMFLSLTKYLDHNISWTFYSGFLSRNTTGGTLEITAPARVGRTRLRYAACLSIKTSLIKSFMQRYYRHAWDWAAAYVLRS